MNPALVKHIDSLQWLRSLPGRPTVVAEIKPRSPFTGWTNPFEIEEQLVICEAVGDIVSVHTDEMWGGDWTLLSDVVQKTKKEVLAKGFHPTIHHVERALSFADWCLTVGWCPKNEPRVWHEVETRDQLINSPADWIVLNSRNPRTGEQRVGRDISVERVCSSIDRLNHHLCQASNIRSAADVLFLMNAVLIGQGLYEVVAPAATESAQH